MGRGPTRHDLLIVVAYSLAGGDARRAAGMLGMRTVSYYARAARLGLRVPTRRRRTAPADKTTRTTRARSRRISLPDLAMIAKEAAMTAAGR